MKVLAALFLACICLVSALHLDMRSLDYGIVEFTVSNPTSKTISFLKWHTPFEGIRSNMFQITSNDVSAQYYGMMLRRASPIDEDYMQLLPSQSTSILVNLLEAYLFPQPGLYNVSYAAPAFSNFNFSEMISITITTSDLANNKANYQNLMNELGTTFEYTNCGTTERTQIQNAVAGSITECDRAYKCMNARTCDATARRWFGAQSSALFDYDKNIYNVVRSQLDARFKAYCNPSGCGSNVYAYVYPTDATLTVYLCGAFWSQANERINTVVHEMSHFRNFGATQDYAYGKSACLNLATSDTTKASHNADNVCYFSEEARTLMA